VLAVDVCHVTVVDLGIVDLGVFRWRRGRDPGRDGWPLSR
jgi:hypothetical protein